MIAGEGREVVEGIAQCAICDVGKVAGTLRRSGYNAPDGDGRLALRRALVGEEKETFVTAVVDFWNENRPAQGGTKLVAFQAIVAADVRARRDGRIEEIACVDGFVANELEGAAMDTVGAGLGDGVDQTARLAAEFGGKVVGLDAEFLQGIGVGHRVGSVGVVVVVLRAVEDVVGAVGAVAIH